MLEDLRFGLKLFRKEKAFTLAALLTLALCIGANTGIFTVLNAVILEPLPFPQPDRLVGLYNIYPGMGITDRGANSVPDYLDRKQMTDVFESIALAGSKGYDVGAAGSPLRIFGEYVTPSYFQVLRASPMLGRLFTESEALLGNEACAILSYGLWKEMFGRDPNILRRDIRLSGVPYRIVGVMPERFAAPDHESRLWVPFAFTPQQASDNARHNNRWGMIGRLKAGVSVGYAQQRIDALNATLAEEFPKYRKMLDDSRFRTKVVRLSDELVGTVQPMLYLLQVAVGLVLLIGCVNVANLMLVRLNVRMKELAIRFSLGADLVAPLPPTPHGEHRAGGLGRDAGSADRLRRHPPDFVARRLGIAARQPHPNRWPGTRVYRGGGVAHRPGVRDHARVPPDAARSECRFPANRKDRHHGAKVAAHPLRPGDFPGLASLRAADRRWSADHEFLPPAGRGSRLQTAASAHGAILPAPHPLQIRPAGPHLRGPPFGKRARPARRDANGSRDGASIQRCERRPRHRDRRVHSRTGRDSSGAKLEFG